MGTHSNVVVSRRRSGCAVVAVLLIGASGCGEPTPPPERPKTLERAIFTLGETSLAIMLPKGAEISKSANSVRKIMIRDVSKAGDANDCSSSQQPQKVLARAMIVRSP